MLRQSTPLLASLSQAGSAQSLVRKSLGRKDGYDEDWLQRLVHENPAVLPIETVEPAFLPVTPVCRELSLPSGYLDNLLVTPLGDLIAVECKLWRNFEARREVFAQTIDYAKDLQRLDYPTLEASIRRARKDNASLFELASGALPEPQLSEIQFIDAVSRNLRLGRCLLLIVGDGISENLESMNEFLQQHAGLQFTLALIQLAIYEVPTNSDQVMVVPSIPLRTMNITRGIVQVTDGTTRIVPPVATARTERPSSLSQEAFLAALDQVRPGLSDALASFLNDLADLQVTWEVKKNLVVRMTVGETEVIPMSISAAGLVDTGFLSYLGKKEIVRPYAEALARAIPGTRVQETPKSLVVKLQTGGFFSIVDALANAERVREALSALNRSLAEMQEVTVGSGPQE